MNLQFLLIIILVVLAIPIIKRIIDNSINRNTSDIETISEMEELFHQRTQNGTPFLRIAYVYDELDIMFIKSIFQSEGIPYFFEFENISNLRLGLAFNDYNKTILNVLEEDYEDAMKILSEYRKNKSSGSQPENNSAKESPSHAKEINTIEIIQR